MKFSMNVNYTIEAEDAAEALSVAQTVTSRYSYRDDVKITGVNLNEQFEMPALQAVAQTPVGREVQELDEKTERERPSEFDPITTDDDTIPV